MALWSDPYVAPQAVEITVEDGLVTLAGLVPAFADRTRIENLVAEMGCVEGVINELQVAGTQVELAGPPARIEAVIVGSQPWVYVTRHCSVAPFSISAALQSALAVLDSFMAEQKVVPAGPMVAKYYNLRGETVTVDVGFPFKGIPGQPDGTQVRLGILPAGSALRTRRRGSLKNLLALRGELNDHARRAGMRPLPYSWHRYLGDLRKGAGTEILAEVYLPLG
jgi:hypothetical protein